MDVKKNKSSRKGQNKKVEDKKFRYSKPHVVLGIYVKSEFTIHAVDVYVKRTLSAMYALDVILFFIGSDELADKANQKANDRINEFIALFEERKEQIQALGPNCSVDSISYSNFRDQSYKIYSPLAVKYLELINAMESAINVTDAVWLGCKIDSGFRNSVVKKFYRILANVSSEMRNIAKNAREVAEERGCGKDIDEDMAINNIKVDTETGDFIADLDVD